LEFDQLRIIIMPLAYDIQDPDLDFAGRAEILSRNLKQAQADKFAEADAPRMMGNWVLNTGPMGGVAAALQRGLGTYNTTQAEAERDLLNKEELRRYDDLTRRMNEPATKTVLTKALKQGQGALAEPEIEQVEQQVPLDMSNPNDLSADNARRMGIAAEMFKLPRAQRVAQDYLTKGANFPEALALLKTKQIEQAMQAQANRNQQYLMHSETIASREQQAAANRALQASLGQGNQAIAQGREDDRRAAAQAKVDAANAKVEDSRARASGLLDQLDTNVDLLDQNKGITSTSRGPLSNAISWAQNTGPGQVLGKMAGTTNQSARNNIENLATNLVLELKNAKGLGASQMNSNMELQRYLTAVGGGQNYDAESLRAAVKNARTLLGVSKSGGAVPAPTPQSGGAPAGVAPQAAIDALKANPALKDQFMAKFGYVPEGL
jgi:hypothetical protein